jgi:tyrosinase
MNATPAAASTLNAAVFGARYDRLEVLTQNLTQIRRTARPISFSTLNLIGAGNSKVLANSADFVGVAGLSRAAIQSIQPSADLSELLDRASRIATQTSIVDIPDAYIILEAVPRPVSASTALRVFINCKEPSASTPIDDPSYVGSVSFFSDHDHDHVGGTNFILDARDTLARLRASGSYSAGAPLDIAVVPVDLASDQRAADSETLKPGRVRIVGLQ